MPDPELVIFDCDGVLVDSERLAVRIDAELLAELGWPLSEAEIVERFMGRSDAHFVAEVESHLGHPPPADWEEAGRGATRTPSGRSRDRSTACSTCSTRSARRRASRRAAATRSCA